MPDTDDGRVILARFEENLAYVKKAVDKILETVEKVVDKAIERDKQIASICATLTELPKLEGRIKDVENKVVILQDLPEFNERLETVEKEVISFRPWVHGLRWFALLLGGAIALAVIGGLLWAVAQSGGLFP